MAQIRNAELVDNLRPDFQHRGEANFAWKSACSAFMALPGLRGFWPLGTFDSAADAYDQSGHGHTLTYNGNPTYNAYDLAPYIDLDGTGDYLERLDEADLDIIGNEAYVAAAIQGLTLGGWFWRDQDRAQGLIGKAMAGGGVFAYNLQNSVALANQIRFEIWDGGGVNRPVNAISAGTLRWEFLCGRFDPNNNLISVFIDGVETQAAIPAATIIRNTGASLAIGNAGGNVLDGRASMCFLCAAALPDVTIFSLYEQTRRLYYV